MLTKLIVVAVLIIIFYCLISALHYLLCRKDLLNTVKALTWRIGLSVLLFAFLFLAYGMGWIQPHGVVPN